MWIPSHLWCLIMNGYLKWDYTGHVTRIKDKKWNVKILEWRPWIGKKDTRRPIKRLYEEIKKVASLL